ncbi:MAG: hypothetical protein ACK5HL_04890 [Bacilli bacterium]
MAKRCKKCGAFYPDDMTHCPTCNDNGTTTNNKSTSNTIPMILSFLIVGAFFLFIGLGGCESEPTQEDLNNAGKWRQCSERSDTFYKCEWNHREDRCTCKER